jgi:hypothetical protein
MVGKCFKCPNGGGGWLYVYFPRTMNGLLIGNSFIRVPSEGSRFEVRIKQDFHSADDITEVYSEISFAELREAFDRTLADIHDHFAPVELPALNVG